MYAIKRNQFSLFSLSLFLSSDTLQPGSAASGPRETDMGRPVPGLAVAGATHTPSLATNRGRAREMELLSRQESNCLWIGKRAIDRSLSTSLGVLGRDYGVGPRAWLILPSGRPAKTYTRAAAPEICRERVSACRLAAALVSAPPLRVELMTAHNFQFNVSGERPSHAAHGASVS